jgi:cholesterol transport system auxiliary component
MSRPLVWRGASMRAAALVVIMLLTTACAALLPKAAPPTVFYALDEAPAALVVTAVALPAAAPTLADPRPTLTVSVPHAAPGFDSQRIVFVREPLRLESFALSEWVDTPARMIAPLIVAALASSGTFRAVVAVPSVVSNELRLDTELVRLQQNFGAGPSRVRFTLRATLVDVRTLGVIAWREFDAEQASTSEDARGGAVAAHRVVHAVLVALDGFCREATAAHVRGRRRRSTAGAGRIRRRCGRSAVNEVRGACPRHVCAGDRPVRLRRARCRDGDAICRR